MSNAQTALVTGASGFIAKHVVLRFLNAGYAVRASLRTPGRADEVRAAVAPHMADPDALGRLSFVTLDLTRDDGWEQAARGVDVVVHTASPFPISQPKDEGELIRPAVDGTLRALRATKVAGVARVVLTSSSVAIVNGALPPGRAEYTEADWSDTTGPTASAYAKSKTLAERAAWDFVKTEAPGMLLTAINPGFVLGTPLDREFGSSVSVIRRFLRGKDPAMPKLGFPVVDVADVAEMHLRAALRPDTAGKRFPASAGSLWFSDMGRVLKAAHPDKKIPTMTAPKMLLRVLALFDTEIRAILPAIGKIERVSNAAAIRDMDMTFTPPEDAVRATADYLVSNGLV
jgi:dihydroflavonol-4-reductase